MAAFAIKSITTSLMRRLRAAATVSAKPIPGTRAVLLFPLSLRLATRYPVAR